MQDYSDFSKRKIDAANELLEMSKNAMHKNSFFDNSLQNKPLIPAISPSFINKIDRDTLLILGILLILYSENCDKLLLLALFYILI